MRVDAPFTVSSFTAAASAPAPPEVTTALPVGVATVEKQFSGDVTGCSVTVFVAAFDQERGAYMITATPTRQMAAPVTS
jgi:hypothetical protein